MAFISRSTFEARSRDTVEWIEPRAKRRPPKGKKIRPELRKERDALLSVRGQTGISASPATTWSLTASPGPSGKDGVERHRKGLWVETPAGPIGQSHVRREGGRGGPALLAQVSFVFCLCTTFIFPLSIPFFWHPQECRTESRLLLQDSLTDYTLSLSYRSSAGAHFASFKRPHRAIQKVNHTSR